MSNPGFEECEQWSGYNGGSDPGRYRESTGDPESRPGAGRPVCFLALSGNTSTPGGVERGKEDRP